MRQVFLQLFCAHDLHITRRENRYSHEEKRNFLFNLVSVQLFWYYYEMFFFRVQGWPLALHYQDQKRLSIFTVTEVLLLNVSKLTVMFKHLCLLCVMYCHLESNLILFLIGSGNKWILNTHFGKWFISVLHQK